MQDWISYLANLSRNAPHLNEMRDRSYGLQIGICTNNEDPQSRRRIKIAPKNKAGQTETDWAERIIFSPGEDPRVPPLGATIIFAYLDGDPHLACYFGILFNAQNPADASQSDPINDITKESPGNEKLTILGDSAQAIAGSKVEEIGVSKTEDIGSEYTLKAGQKIEIKCANVSISISSESIKIEQESAFIQLSASGGLQMDAGGKTVNISNATDFQIGGKSVAVIGTMDNMGQTLMLNPYGVSAGAPAIPLTPSFTADNFQASSGTWVTVYNTNQAGGSYWRNNPANLNDEFQINLTAKAGNWNLNLLGITASNYGIITVYLGNTSLGTIDWYSATQVYNVTKTLAINIPTSGVIILRLKITGKNASSSGYLIGITKVQMI